MGFVTRQQPVGRLVTGTEVTEIRHRIGSTLGLALISLIFVSGSVWMLTDGSGDVEVRPGPVLLGLAVGGGSVGVALRYVTGRVAILTGLATGLLIGAMLASPDLVLPIVGVLLFGVGGVLAVGQRLTQRVAIRLDSDGVTWRPKAWRPPVTAPWAAVDGFVHQRMNSNNVVVVLGDRGRVTGLDAAHGMREGVLAWVMIGQRRDAVVRFVQEANTLIAQR